MAGGKKPSKKKLQKVAASGDARKQKDKGQEKPKKWQTAFSKQKPAGVRSAASKKVRKFKWSGLLDKFKESLVKQGSPQKSEKLQAFLQRAPKLQPLLRQLCTIEGLVALMLAALLFYPPYFRGLFFAKELLPTHIFTALIFTIFVFYKLSRKELAFMRQPLDYAVFAFLGFYILSTLTAWNDHDAIEAVLKMANYVAVYWLLAYGVRSLRAAHGYLSVMFAGGTGVALLGLGAAFGTFHYNDAFVSGRIFSSLQYPNSLASYLAALNIFGLVLWAAAKRLPIKIAYAVGCYLMFLTFLGTQSRGAFLVFPLVLVIFFCGLGRYRLRVLGQFLLQVVAVLAVAGKTASCFGGEAEFAGWLWLIAGALLTALLQGAWWHFEQFFLKGKEPAEGFQPDSQTAAQQADLSKKRLRPWVAPAVLAVFVLALAWGGYSIWRNLDSPVVAKIMPEAWLERVESISLAESSAQDRLRWSVDAFKIMAGGPVNALLGAGGGGWNALYHKYQSYYYFSTEVHNHFLQVGVETGFPGLLTFCAIWLCLCWSTWRLCRKRKITGPLAEGLTATGWAVFCAALALGIHSAIDFNLSLGAICITLWALFGIVRALERSYAPDEGEQLVPDASKASQAVKKKGLFLSQGWLSALAATVAAVCFFISLSMMVGQKNAVAAAAELEKQQNNTAVARLEEAVKSDPWNSSYSGDLGRIYLFSGEQNKDARLLKRSQDLLEKAVSHNRGDYQLRLLYARALFSTGLFPKGVEQLEQAVDLMPFKQEGYENLASGCFTAGRYLLTEAGKAESGKAASLKEKARGYLEEAVSIPERINEKMAQVSEEEKKLWTRAPLLTVSLRTHLESGKAAALLGDWEIAGSSLEAAAGDPELKAEALLWHGLALQEQGQTEKGEQLLAEAYKLQPELKEQQKELKNLFLK